MMMTNDVAPQTQAAGKKARNLGMLCHLLAFCGLIIPLGNILGPLILWALKKDEHPFVDDQGKESMNFQITATIAYMIGIILLFIFIGMLLLPLLFLYVSVMIIMAAIKANGGRAYRYPITFRFIK